MSGIVARVGGSALAVAAICCGGWELPIWPGPPPPPTDVPSGMRGALPHGYTWFGAAFFASPLGAVIDRLWVVVQLGREARQRSTNDGAQAR